MGVNQSTCCVPPRVIARILVLYKTMLKGKHIPLCYVMTLFAQIREAWEAYRGAQEKAALREEELQDELNELGEHTSAPDLPSMSWPHLLAHSLLI